MIESTFIDYYDQYLDKNKYFTRLKSDKLSLSDFNAYRYTLIVGTTCFDFVYRDGEIIMGEKLVDLGAITQKGCVKIKCLMEDYFTNVICRYEPYPDLNGFNSKNESLVCIIQNKDKIYNTQKNVKFGNDSDLFINPKLKSLNFDGVLNGEIISFILNNYLLST